MLRDRLGTPTGDWFIRHGSDAESRWAGDVPHLTPNERFFVRNHTRAAIVDPFSWRLLVTGDGVLGDTTYSLRDLRAFTSATYERALECAGNGRSLFATQQHAPRPGTPWGLGAIGVARWTGVPLSTVLRHAGLRPDAVQVMPVGLDEPYIVDGVSYGHVRRPLPIGKALDDVLIALDMNGEPLPRDHGFPARLLVPGWAGIASIKWLGELRVTTQIVDSPWNTRWYRMRGVGWSDGTSALNRMPVKSTLDAADDPIVDRPAVLRGRAWSGEASIRSVEVSTDGGRQWQEATFTGPNEPSSWVRWELTWTPRRPGTHQVLTCATDSDGRTQPPRSPDNDHGYLFSAVVQHAVEVGAHVESGVGARKH